MAMKWLRKHNKKILVVGGALLMLAFLMPRQQGCGRGPRMKDRAVAQAFGKKVMASEFSWANLEMRILRTIGVGVPVADPIDYALLLREARQMHIPAGAENVPERLAAEIAQTNKVPDLAALASQLSKQQQDLGIRITEKMLRRALGNRLAVEQVQNLVLGAPKQIPQQQGRPMPDFRTTLGLAQPSRKELELLFRDVSEKLDIAYVTLPAWRYGSAVQAPGEAEIIRQFEAYKDQYSGTVENEFGFGYKQPKLIQIEYIKADVNKIMAGLEEPTPAVLAEYYEKNKEFYALPVENEAEGQDEAISEQADKTEPVKQYKPFEEVYEDLKDRWLKNKARETALSMVARGRNLSRSRWKELEKEQKDTDLNPAELYPYTNTQGESLVSKLTEEFNVTPDYQRTGWIDISQAESLEGIGVSYGTGPVMAFSVLVSSVRSSSEQQAQAQTNTPFEVGQDSPINLIDTQGNAYLFRVIGLKTEKTLSIQEMLKNEKIRNNVSSDVLLQRAYEYAKRQGQQLLELARQDGLNKALEDFGDKNLQARQTGLLARDAPKRVLLNLQIPLVDEQGNIQGEVELQWQDISRLVRSAKPVGILSVKATNKAKTGKITAIGLNLPYYLRIACPEIRHLGSQVAAGNGNGPAPAGPEGYTLRYFGRGIEAGPAGKFDLLISAQGQELANTPNLRKAGIEPENSEVFQLQLLHLGLPLSTIDFVSSSSSRTVESGGVGFNLVARLEMGDKSKLLRGILPANRRSGFIRECFAVLDRAGVIHKTNPPIAPEEVQDESSELPVRDPELLIDAQSQQAPCVLIEVPREGLCYVAEVQKHLRLSREEFRQAIPAARNALMSKQYASLQQQWFNSNNIRQRTGYQPIGIEQDKRTEEE